MLLLQQLLGPVQNPLFIQHILPTCQTVEKVAAAAVVLAAAAVEVVAVAAAVLLVVVVVIAAE